MDWVERSGEEAREIADRDDHEDRPCRGCGNCGRAAEGRTGGCHALLARIAKDPAAFDRVFPAR
jgi:hypothetical protein